MATRPPVTNVPVLPFPDQEDALHGHLFIHHSLYVTDRCNMAAMYECHEDEHAMPELIPHPHVHAAPAPAQDEWSWE